jgi:hypothetical protein
VFNAADIDGFDWDEGNRDKNWLKHAVSTGECEELFFNLPLVVAVDVKHSASEERFLALGRTNGGRLLFVSFTVRGQLIRVISARDMSRKEREIYEEANT